MSEPETSDFGNGDEKFAEGSTRRFSFRDVPGGVLMRIFRKGDLTHCLLRGGRTRRQALQLAKESISRDLSRMQGDLKAVEQALDGDDASLD